MDKRSNNYLVIMIVLLLVVAIITGAGLCYLSWSDDYGQQRQETAQSTEYAQDTEEQTETTEPTQASSESSEEPAVYHKGIDVSKYQKQIDWKLVAADGVEYAFIRVGCRGYGKSGKLIQDEMFHQNVQGALEQGIEVGVYFFTQAITEDEAVKETELIIKALEGYDITYPVAIDVERIQNDKARQDALTAEERTALCKIFCEKIKEAGYIPMIYGNSETFSELLIPEELEAYDFWICETDDSVTFPYEFAVWQYSHEGKVSGISTETNLSFCIKEW